MLTGEDFRRRHQRRLRAGFDGVQHREERDQRLAGPDIALQKAHAPLGRRHVGEDVRKRAALVAGEVEGERLQRRGAKPAVATDRAARRRKP